MHKIFINLDCDGVLANFVKGACDIHQRPLAMGKWDFYEDWGMTSDQFWAKCCGYQFWTNLEVYDHAHDLVNNLRALCKNYSADLTITTAPALDPECINAKLKWLNHHFGIKPHDIIFGPKKWIMAHANSILIDDKPLNIFNYVLCGGHGILFPQPWNNSAGDESIGDWRDVIKTTINILESLSNHDHVRINS